MESAPAPGARPSRSLRTCGQRCRCFRHIGVGRHRERALPARSFGPATIPWHRRPFREARPPIRRARRPPRASRPPAHPPRRPERRAAMRSAMPGSRSLDPNQPIRPDRALGWLPKPPIRARRALGWEPGTPVRARRPRPGLPTETHPGTANAFFSSKKSYPPPSNPAIFKQLSPV